MCNVTKVSTRMSVHTLGNWDQSIIHGLCRTLVPDIKDVGAGVAERVSYFWDSRYSTQLAELVDQTLLRSVVRLQERDFLIKFFIA